MSPRPVQRVPATSQSVTTDDSAAQNLPNQLTSFVGRAAELADVRDILEQNRLVTLTGAGGVGKTRLAVQVAATVAGDYTDGTWYVDLAPITDPDWFRSSQPEHWGCRISRDVPR